MELNGALFSPAFTWVFGSLYAGALYLALRLAPWGRLFEGGRLHVFLGAVLCLLLLWQLRASVNPGLAYHLLGVTAVTLMFGWSLAVIATSLALLGLALNSGGGWDAFVINAVLSGVLPATLSQCLLVLIRHYLPRHFFVYVLVNGFLTAGFAGLVSGCLAAGLLVWSGAYSFAELDQTLLPFFPLMFLPEAMLNGMVMTMLVVLRPAWVRSFSDAQYLHGK
jgi:uncharacterized membrane protein